MGCVPISQKNNNLLHNSIFASTIIFSFLLAVRKIEDFDIFWHLKAGEMTFRTRRVLLEDAFSHTMAGTEWIPHEWLTEVLFYITYRLGGLEGLGILSGGVVAAAAALAWLRARNIGGNTWIVALIMIWVLLTARFRFMVRPHIFFFLFSGGLLFLLERHLHTGRRVFGWAVIPLMVLWVNMHGSFPLGYLFLLAWSVTTFRRDRSIFPSAVFIIASVGVFLNPGGWKTLIMVKDLFLSTTVSRSIVNQEFLPPTLEGYPLFWAFLLFAASITAVTARKVPISLLEATVFFFTALMALRGVRFIADFAILTAPYVASRASFLLETLTADRPYFPRVHSASRSVIGFCLLIALMAAGFLGAYGQFKTYRWGLGLNEKFVPIGATNFLKSTELRDVRLYNSSIFGGYLTWELYPRFRVAWDGRDEVFGPLHRLMYSENRIDYQTLMERYRFQIAVIGHGKEIGFERLLASDSAWVLVYWDDQSLVYAREGEVVDDFIYKYAYKYFSPFSLDYSYLSDPVRSGKGEEVLFELKRATAENPGAFKPWVYIGYVYDLLGKHKESAAAYEQALSINPELGIGHYRLAAKLGRIYSASGRPDLAKDALDRHFSVNPGKGEEVYVYALSLYELKEYKKAEEHFRRYLAENPDEPRALSDLGFLLMDTGRTKEAEQAFKKAIAFYPEGPGLYGLALTYQRMGDCKKALPLWKEVVQSNRLSGKWLTKASQYIKECSKALNDTDEGVD